ncbi:MAG TPA: iron-sulfur cluster assembly protein [Anaerolineaceae bacterium]|nr:iron-sulfur cluster assembly protein [Anaerolineaceae bacterium]
MTEEKPNQPIWEIESTNPELVDPVKEAMREIVDPEIGLNIIQLGLIRDVKLHEDDAQITMILTTPFCPYGPALLDTTRQKAEEVLKKPTFINIGMEMWDFSMMEEGAAGADWGLY